MAVVEGERLPANLTTVLSLLVLIPIVYYVYMTAVYIRKVRKIGRGIDQFPGPEKHWLYGNLREHPGPNEKGLAWMAELANKYRTAFRLWFGPFRAAVICVHPSTVKTVLRSTEPKQTTGIYGMLRGWLGDGLLLSSGNKWFRNRRLLTPAFHFDVLKPYMQIYNEAGDIFLDKLGAASKSGSVEITRPITLLTLNVILRCAFSSDLDVQREGQSHPYVNAVMDMARLLTKRFFRPIMHNDVIYSMSTDGKKAKNYLSVVHGLSEDVIAKRKRALRANPEEVKKRHLDFLDILLVARDEDGAGLTDREIRDEVDTFLFEGHDTTASAISWVLYEMARNPDHQQTCREEVEQFMGSRKSDEMTWDDLSQMRFTSQCIKEAMRMHSPVPYIARQVSKEFELDGIKLQPGTFVDVVIYLCNHNEDVWGPDHLEYKPERFEADSMENMDSFAFVPFSAGPRFNLTLDKDHLIEHVPEVVMRAAHGIKVFLEPRK